MKQQVMRSVGGLFIGLLALPILFFFAYPAQAQAVTYTTTTYASQDVLVKLQALLVQLLDLQRQLNALQGGSSTGSKETVESVEVELFSDYAEVEIRYKDGDEDDMLFNADTESEVIDFLVSETKNTRSHLIAVTDFEDGDDRDDDNDGDIEDIRSIEVEIRNGDAHVEVRFDDGDTDTFTIDNETQHQDIIDEVADELDLDADDVEDIIDFENSDSNDDVDEIEVTVFEDDDEAEAEVHFDDGDTTTYTFDTDNEDDIIEELADLLDMRQADVEDLIDWTYEDDDNADDVDEIEVTIYDEDDESEALVRYNDGDTTRYNFDTDNEDDIIEELADLLDMDEDDVEDLTDFDYDD